MRALRACLGPFPGKIRFFYLATHHNTYVYISPENNRLVHDVKEVPQFRETFFVQFGSCPSVGLIILATPRKLLEGNVAREVKLHRNFFFVGVATFTDQGLTLKNPRTGSFYCADATQDVLKDNRNHILDWEVFHLEEVNPPQDTNIVDFTLNVELCLRALSDVASLPALIVKFWRGYQAEILESLFDLLEQPQQILFCQLFLRDYQDDKSEQAYFCWQILTALPQGNWLLTSLTRLHRWKISRDFIHIDRADSQYDFLGFPRQREERSGAWWGSRILAVNRSLCQPEKTLAVLATARDEGLYIIEWLAHYRLIGVEQFFIYSNDLTDGSGDLLRILAQAGEIVWIDNSGDAPAGINMQDKAYGHALTSLPDILDYRWCLTVDLDEFVLPSQEWNFALHDLLKAREREGADAVAMSWRIYSSNQHLAWTPDLTVEKFVKAESHPLIKTAFKPNRFDGATPHHPTSSLHQTYIFSTIDGERHDLPRGQTHDINFAERSTRNAEVCHFHIRSLEEFVWKFARGENDYSGVLREKRFRYNQPTIFNLFLSHFEQAGEKSFTPLIGEIKREMRRLMAIPGVRSAMREIEERFQEQIPRFVEQSLELMQRDERISAEDKAQWEKLVVAWRHHKNAQLSSFSA